MKELSQLLGINSPSSLVKLQTNVDSNINVWCKRDDLLHPIISGNKWRKLGPILQQARNDNVRVILSFGGAYSNHLHALAYCCKQLSIQLVAIVRGHEPKHLSPTLQDIQAWGATIHWVSYAEYSLRNSDTQIMDYLKRFNADLHIPEGGSSSAAISGIKSLVDELMDEKLSAQEGSLTPLQFDHTFVPVGSGATMAGLIQYGGPILGTVHGIAVLKGDGYLETLVGGLLDDYQQSLSARLGDAKNIALAKWHIHHQYHFGGYAKTTTQLDNFIEEFEQQHHFVIEKVYSAKCFFAAIDLIAMDSMKESSVNLNIRPNTETNVLLIHTGGLQGRRKRNSG